MVTVLVDGDVDVVIACKFTIKGDAEDKGTERERSVLAVI